MNVDIIILIITSCCFVDASVIINSYVDNDDCSLDPELVEEIASYKNATKSIGEAIMNSMGEIMFNEYVNFIDKFGARPSGSEVLEQSIDYMINLTLKNGLNDVTTEEMEVPHWVRGQESAVMIKPRVKEIAILGFGSSVSTPDEGITADAIVVQSFDELDNMDKAHIERKIVVFDAPYKSYGETVVYRTQGAVRAAKKGAVATLVRSVTPFSIYTPHTGAQYYEDDVPKIPTAAITHEDADLLRRLQNETKQIVLNIKMSSKFEMKKSRNTIIDFKGSEHPEKLVIVSGHIDSWDVGQGAMDDGGGMFISWFVPVALSLLEKRPKRTIRAILWTAEEPGLIGAQAYLKKHEEELANIDFIMESDEGTFSPLGLDVAGSDKARCIIQKVLQQLAPINKMTNSGSPGSDITMFIKKGVPGASLLNKNERYYWFHHSEGDTLNVQNKADMIECVSFWIQVSYAIANLSVDIPRN